MKQCKVSKHTRDGAIVKGHTRTMKSSVPKNTNKDSKKQKALQAIATTSYPQGYL